MKTGTAEMNSQDFSSRMANVPDEQLVRIAFSSVSEGFVPEAIAAAKQEIERRGIEPAQTTEIMEKNPQ